MAGGPELKGVGRLALEGAEPGLGELSPQLDEAAALTRIEAECGEPL